MTKILLPFALAACTAVASCGGTDNTRALVASPDGDCIGYASRVANASPNRAGDTFQRAYQRCMGWE